MPNTSTDRIKIDFLPKRSAKGPAMNAPSMKPNWAAENTGPNVLTSNPRVLAMAGAVMPMMTESKPSISAAMAHRKKTLSWYFDIGRLSIRFVTFIVSVALIFRPPSFLWRHRAELPLRSAVQPLRDLGVKVQQPADLVRRL